MWSNTKTDDLWAVLEEVSGLPVKYVMDSWVKKRGFPVVSVNVNLNELEIRQVRFILEYLNNYNTFESVGLQNMENSDDFS